MTLDVALSTLTFAGAGNVEFFSFFEVGNGDFRSCFIGLVFRQAEFGQILLERSFPLCEVTLCRLVGATFFQINVTDLNRIITVGFFRLDLRSDTDRLLSR